jgi:hypothetical protein
MRRSGKLHAAWTLPDLPGKKLLTGLFFFFQKWRRTRFIEHAVMKNLKRKFGILANC